MLLDQLRHEISCKIVYYGTGLSGKTTNLKYIFSQVDPKCRGEMVTTANRSDRTLFFDLLPLDLGDINGWKLRYYLYTVPGQVQYNASRKLILGGADAVVFVADSAPDRMDDNQESIKNLFDNMAEHNLSIEKVPVVLQFNKRDLADAMPIEKMSAELNQHNFDTYESTASEGRGVIQTLQGVSKALTGSIKAFWDEVRKE
jgi:signal recognition particle receptor subunit beta